jgi:hypothetical protein
MGDFYVCVNCGETCKGHHECATSRPVTYRAIPYRPFDTVAVLLPETPDPRDARIAELEAALAGLVDAQAHCMRRGCTRRALREAHELTPAWCEEHATETARARVLNADAIEAAERALGRRK